jgi:predicted site-specific integrase-resolvase
MDNNFLSVRQASDLLDISERTITRQIKTGKLSANKSDNGFWQIEKSEFYRVYPAYNPETRTDNESDKVRSMTDNNNIEIIELLKKQIASLEDQLRQSNKEKDTILDTLRSNQRMLEHQSQPRRKILGIF